MRRLLVPLLLAGLPAVAAANGQVSHLWVTTRAVEEVPGGELGEFLQRDELRVMLLAGTMFPDGGYAVGHGYGETAHWEPFQSRYLDWIRTEGAALPAEERDQHLAFLLGMASHGMSDQVFDALYVERAREEDGASDWVGGNFDLASDVVFSSRTGAPEIPEAWVPADPLVSLFETAGVPVDADTLEEAQGLLQVAVWWVGEAGQNPEAVAEHQEAFPWGTGNLLEETAAGAPPDDALAVARYWQEIWDRFQGADTPATPVIATFPADGALGHPRTGAAARVGLVFARGLEPDTAGAGAFQVEDGGGTAIPVSAWVYYGRSSHVVLLAPPETGWPADADLTVTALPGITAIDGTVLEAPWSFGFSTRVPEGDSGADTGDTPPEGGCGCAAAGGGSWGWLGLLALGIRRRRR